MFLDKNTLLKTWLNPVLKLMSFRDTIANFSRLYCLEIPRRDHKENQTKYRKMTKSLGVMLEF